ncbi:MAG TPA: gamma-glutamyl-gamma-aminobutyrate hydrolase family protein [Candidatus Brocadiia bacterium]|nr:gamma-glutamyl-gamma-aminobutyrate hydrolase family protein [Candidatus Brocadiia bacterium]
MSRTKPRIGICGVYGRVNENAACILPDAYVDAVALAGGVPLLLAPPAKGDLAADMMDAVDALLVPGGPDISPARYGQQPHPKTRLVHERREAFDFRCVEEAEKRNMPMMGICLGCQVINVARGGTLVQDVPSQWAAPLVHPRPPAATRLLHWVEVEPGTRLAGIVGHGRFEVNTSHHQAVDKPGRGLRVSARALDGVIEAVEDTSGRFVLGIQWHPEGMTERPRHLALFQALIQAAKDFAQAAR